MNRETAHKAIAAFLTSFLTMLTGMGVVMPVWVTDTGINLVSFIIATLLSLFGGGIVSAFTYQVPNKPKPPKP